MLLRYKNILLSKSFTNNFIAGKFFSSSANIDLGNQSAFDGVEAFDLTLLSKNTANSKQILKNKINDVVQKYQVRDGDTGSTSVQIAALTEKIINLTRHFAMHKKDKHSKRGFEVHCLN